MIEQTPTTDLLALMREAASYQMTPEEIREQKISFVFGLLSSDSTLKKEDVRRIMEEHGL